MVKKISSDIDLPQRKQGKNKGHKVFELFVR